MTIRVEKEDAELNTDVIEKGTEDNLVQYDAIDEVVENRFKRPGAVDWPFWGYSLGTTYTKNSSFYGYFKIKTPSDYTYTQVGNNFSYLNVGLFDDSQTVPDTNTIIVEIQQQNANYWFNARIKDNNSITYSNNVVMTQPDLLTEYYFIFTFDTNTQTLSIELQKVSDGSTHATNSVVLGGNDFAVTSIGMSSRPDAINSSSWDNWWECSKVKVNDGLTEQNFPNAPSNPSPADTETDIGRISITMSWDCTDPDPGDTLTYDVYLDTVTPPVTLVSDDQAAKTYNATNLDTLTTYYWQIVAKDNNNNSTEGPIWEFTTGNTEPYLPSAPTPSNEAVDVALTGSTLSWQGGDPDPTDSVVYDVYFDTVNPPVDLVSDDQGATTYALGTLASYQTYYWKIIAKDQNGVTTDGPIWQFRAAVDPIANAEVTLLDSKGNIIEDSSGNIKWITDVNGQVSITGLIAQKDVTVSILSSGNTYTSTGNLIPNNGTLTLVITTS